MLIGLRLEMGMWKGYIECVDDRATKVTLYHPQTVTEIK